MEVEISKEVDKEIEQASRIMGFKKREIVERAIKLYLEDIKKSLELKRELKAWERLGEESLLNFEKKI